MNEKQLTNNIRGKEKAACIHEDLLDQSTLMTLASDQRKIKRSCS